MDKHTIHNISLKENENRARKAAALPALLLCAVILIVLVLDVFMPFMTERQYVIFPFAIRSVSLVSIVCAALCFSYELSNNKFRIDLKDIFFMLFLLCVFISTGINGINHMAVFGKAYRYVGVYDILVFICVYMYCSSRIHSERLKTVFINFFLITSDLIALAFFYNFITGKIDAFNGKAEPSAIFFHGNHYGYFLVIAIILSAGCMIYLKGSVTILGGVSLITDMAALALNRSLGSLIAVGVVLMIMTINSVIMGGDERKKSCIMMFTIIFFALAAVLAYKPLRVDISQTIGELIQILSGDNNIYAGNGRWGIWQYVAGYIKEAPVWGYGCESISEIMRDYTLTGSPHNEPLTYAAFFGIPAAVLYCLGVIAAVIDGLKAGAVFPFNRIAAFGTLGYFISSVFGVAMFYTAPFLFVLIGISSDEVSGS